MAKSKQWIYPAIKWWIFPQFVVLVYQVGYPIMLRRPKSQSEMITSPSPCFIQASWLNIGLLCAHYYIPLLPSNSSSFRRIIPFQRNPPTMFFMYSHYFQGKSPQTCPNWVFPRMVRGSFSTSSPLWIATGWFPASIDIIPDQGPNCWSYKL